MHSFESVIREVGTLKFPEWAGVRVMMMPVRLDDPRGTLPDSMAQWREALAALVAVAPTQSGVGYLTVDEAEVAAGETHRRPGLHVDGVGPDGRAGGWGAGGKYAANGMLCASTVVGCRGWVQKFSTWPAPNGDCAALAAECRADAEVVMQPGRVYWCSPLAVHEALPMRETVRRQFVRLSMPSDAPWYEGYTRNPTGVEPTGEVHPRREFMDYRP